MWLFEMLAAIFISDVNAQLKIEIRVHCYSFFSIVLFFSLHFFPIVVVVKCVFVRFFFLNSFAFTFVCSFSFCFQLESNAFSTKQKFMVGTNWSVSLCLLNSYETFVWEWDPAATFSVLNKKKLTNKTVKKQKFFHPFRAYFITKKENYFFMNRMNANCDILSLSNELGKTYCWNKIVGRANLK